MKSSKISDFFQPLSGEVACPACGISINKSQINSHLDASCSSLCDTNLQDFVDKSVTTHKSAFISRPNLKSSKSQDGKRILQSSRLSLKQQRKQSVTCIVPENLIEVVTIDEDFSEGNCSDTRIFKLDNDVTKEATYNQALSCSESANSDEPNHPKPYSHLSLEASVSENELQCSSSKEIILQSSIETVNNSNPVSNNKINQQMEIKSNMPCKQGDNPLSLETCTSENKMSCNDKEVIIKPLIEEVNNYCSVLNDESHMQTDNQSTMTHKSIYVLTKFVQGNQHSPSPDQSSNKFEVNCVNNDVQKFDDLDDKVPPNQFGNNQDYEPYYIANFKHILEAVLSDETYQVLFNDEDRRFIQAFESSSDSAQKLYVRLFGRKYKWLRFSKISYPKIAANLSSFLQELVQKGLVDYGSDTIELEAALDLLSLPEAKTVAKQFHVNPTKGKASIIEMLLKHCKNHKSVFFSSGKNSISQSLLKKLRSIIGPCYRISLLPKRLFTRILMLFSLPTMSADDDDAAGGQQQQLLTLLQINRGELIFPCYKISRETLVFADRDELIRYEEAKQLENDLMNAAESRNYDLAKELYLNARETFEEHVSSSFVHRAESLPTFLKKFTSFHIYVRCMTQGVEILQRMRQYQEAVDLLRSLLSQKVFCQDYRGRWWDRLALNLEQHLKKKNEALEAIKEAFVDENVRVGHRYSLLIRALRLLKVVDDDDDFKKRVLEASNVLEAPKVVFQGRLCPRDILGRRNVFISSAIPTESADDVTVLGVEQLAIQHYQNAGYSQGIHGEGSTFHSVYGLLFWDIIYDGDVPDAFISPYQNHPLDLNHSDFFKRREKRILERLDEFKNLPIEEIKSIVKLVWEAHCGQSSLVFWDRFSDVNHMLGLIECMGNKLICGICDRLAHDFRFTRSGVPDLVVWNPDTLKVKIVEVKGPNDKLSSKQILWLDYLLRLGADAEVCHIEAVASKKLRRE